MIKAIQALLAGVFFTFILDFFLFLGIKLHYVDRYEIDVYYNILFADHQNGWLYALGTLALGALTIYYPNAKRAAMILALLFALSLSTLIPPVGHAAGEAMLMQKSQRLFDGRYVYTGDVYYVGREFVYIFDDELQRLVKLPKKDLKP